MPVAYCSVFLSNRALSISTIDTKTVQSFFNKDLMNSLCSVYCYERFI